jgi:hypothetical protein
VEGQLKFLGSAVANEELPSILQVKIIVQFLVFLAEFGLLIANFSYILATQADRLIASRAVAQIANMKWLALQGVFCSNSARSQNCGKETNGKGHKLYYKFTNLI